MMDSTASEQERAEAFTDRALELARAIWPEIVWRRAETLRLIGEQGGMPFSIGLLNAYQAAATVTDPDEIDALLTAFLRALPLDASALDTLELEAVRERIFPMLKPAASLEAVSASMADPDRRPVYRPWEAGLVIALVLDAPDNVTYLRQCDLARWGVDFDSLLELALENLEAASEGLPLKMSQSPDEDTPSAFIVIDSGDGYDATRILLPRQRDFLAEYLGPEYLVGIPNRDFLIAFTFDLARQFAPLIRDDARQRQYPLTGQILLVTPDGVEVWRGF